MKIFIDNLRVKAILYMDKKLRKSVEGILSDTIPFFFSLKFQIRNVTFLIEIKKKSDEF